jgi:hypothetical protein
MSCKAKVRIGKSSDIQIKLLKNLKVNNLSEKRDMKQLGSGMCSGQGVLMINNE